MKFKGLGKKENGKVVDFFSMRYSLPKSFWKDVSLLKRVNSVWLCSKEAALLANDFHSQSCGLLVLLELKTLKESRQAMDFFASLASKLERTKH